MSLSTAYQISMIDNVRNSSCPSPVLMFSFHQLPIKNKKEVIFMGISVSALNTENYLRNKDLRKRDSGITMPITYKTGLPVWEASIFRFFLLWSRGRYRPKVPVASIIQIWFLPVPCASTTTGALGLHCIVGLTYSIPLLRSIAPSCGSYKQRGQ